METQKKGDLAKAKAIAKFTEMKYVVSLPMTESAPYDIVVEKDGIMKRVQVKYFGSKGTPYLRTRRIHSNSTGYVVKALEENSYDWAYVYCNTGSEYLLKEQPTNKSAFYFKEEHKI